MRIEFRQGVPEGCVIWLWDNVGSGNLHRRGAALFVRKETDLWFYERIKKAIVPHTFSDDPFEYVPTITVKDEKLAMLFSLRWS